MGGINSSLCIAHVINNSKQYKMVIEKDNLNLNKKSYNKKIYKKVKLANNPYNKYELEKALENNIEK